MNFRLERVLAAVFALAAAALLPASAPAGDLRGTSSPVRGLT
jgi:hypothetical protein